MNPLHLLRWLGMLLALNVTDRVAGQNIPFTSGPIPPCDTSTFSANVVGVGWLGSAWIPWSSWLESLTINIISDHPHTLKITLTSPVGTTLLLSAFNGNGGQNYTNTTFYHSGGGNITTGTAPFTGAWSPEGGSFSAFSGEYGDGTWTITVIDTACANGGTGPGGTWTPGWFHGGGTGGFAFGFAGPPPCADWIPNGHTYLCPGESVDILAYYVGTANWYNYNFSLGGTTVADPSHVTTPGSYLVDAFDSWGGCWYQATYDVIASPAIDLGPDRILDRCSDDVPVDLAALFQLAGVAATWSINGTSITGTAVTAATTAGTYRLIGSNTGGCNDTAFVTLNVAPAPALGPDALVSICTGGSSDLGTLYATDGLTTSWTFGGDALDDPTDVTIPGIYTLVATSPAGCTDEALVTLDVGQQPDLGTDLTLDICAGSSVDLTALFNTTGSTSSWYLGGNAVPAPSSVSSAGTYSIVAGSSPTCSDEAQVILSVHPLPALGNDHALTTCAGSSIDLTTLFNTNGLSSTWYHGAAAFGTPAIASDAGTYTLIATDGVGCSDTARVTIAVESQVDLGPDRTHAFCDNTSLDLTPIFALNGLVTIWSHLGSPVPDPTTITNGGIYSLIASADTMCPDTALVMVDALTAPDLGPDRTAAVCAGNGADLTSLFDLDGQVTEWTLTGSTIAPPVSADEDGVYRLIATNTAGCRDTALVSLTVNEPPSLGPDQTLSTCSDTGIDLTTVHNAGSNSAEWTLNGTIVTDASAVTVAGNYLLTLTNALGCSVSTVVTVVIEEAPLLGIDTNVAICEGSAADLTGIFDTTGYTTVWSRNNSPVLDPQAAGIAGTYRLVAFNAAGCTDTAFVQLTVDPSPDLGPDRTFSLCPWSTLDLLTEFPLIGSSATLTRDGDPVDDPSSISAPGTYAVVMTNTAGCSDEVQVSVLPMECLCEAEFTHDARCAQEPTQFTLIADSTVLGAHWDFGAAAPPSGMIHPQVTFIPGETVIVTLTASLSCGVVRVEREIIVPDCSEQCHVWIPSSFTPNGDARNDVWTWYGECMPEEFSMNVFDRLGELVFSTNDPMQAWDGSYGGILSPGGVYAYRVGYKLPYRKNEQVVGSITLIR